MSLKQISPVETPASQGRDEEAVMTRLKTLFHLALAIGGREGLLGDRSAINGSVLPKDSIDEQSEEVKSRSRQANPATGRRPENSGLRRGPR